jgi:hypothetical protein
MRKHNFNFIGRAAFCALAVLVFAPLARAQQSSAMAASTAATGVTPVFLFHNPLLPQDDVKWAEVTADGNFLLNTYRGVRVYTSTGALVRDFDERAFAFSPNGRYFAGLVFDDSVERIPVYGPDETGESLVPSGESASLQVTDINGNLIWKARFDDYQYGFFHGLEVSNAGAVLAHTDDSHALLFAADGRPVNYKWFSTHAIQAGAFSEDGEYFASADHVSQRGGVCVLRVQDMAGKVIATETVNSRGELLEKLYARGVPGTHDFGFSAWFDKHSRFFFYSSERGEIERVTAVDTRGIASLTALPKGNLLVATPEATYFVNPAKDKLLHKYGTEYALFMRALTPTGVAAVTRDSKLVKFDFSGAMISQETLPHVDALLILNDITIPKLYMFGEESFYSIPL